jgi:hypothetical protein
MGGSVGVGLVTDAVIDVIEDVCNGVDTNGDYYYYCGRAGPSRKTNAFRDG